MNKFLILLCLLSISCFNLRKGDNKSVTKIYFIKEDSLLLTKSFRFNFISSGKILYDKKEAKLIYKDDLKNKFLTYNYTYNNYKCDSLVLLFKTNFKFEKDKSAYSNTLVEINSIYMNDSLDIFKINKDNFNFNFRINHKPKYFYVCTFCNKSLNKINFNIPPISHFDKLDTLKINLEFPDFILSSGLNYSELNFDISKLEKKYMELNSTQGLPLSKKIFLNNVTKF